MTRLLSKWLMAFFASLVLTGSFAGSWSVRGAVVFAEKSEPAVYGGTLIIGITSDVDSFNPLFGETAFSQEITHLLLLGLADLNENSEFVPELATHWERSHDYRKLTYYLRKDAVWSDGVPITAEDVKFTFDLLMDRTVASPRQGVTDFIKRVVVNDAHSVTFEFSQSYPDQIFDTAGEILPRHLLEQVPRARLRNHRFGRNPLSSGPFLLKKWLPQQYIELIPNPMYFAGRPYLDRVIFKIVPDVSNLLIQMQTGEIDMMIGVPPGEVDRLLKKNPQVKIYPVSGRIYYYIGYNLQNPLFASVAVRRALTLAIDRQGIIDALLFGYGRVCVGPVPPILQWAVNDEIKEIPFDPEQAQKLLAAEGWLDRDKDGWLDKQGQPFKFILKTNTGNQLRSDIAVIVQDRLKKIGIAVEIETIERAALIKALRSKNFEAFMGGWSTSLNLDPTPIFHSASTEQFNFGNYSNPEVDQLIEQGRMEVERTQAIKTWQKFQQIIYQEQPYTFLFWKDRLIAVNAQFKNVNPIPLSALYELEKWYRSGHELTN
ncbi:MAG: peptide-binding protein [bacterium]